MIPIKIKVMKYLLNAHIRKRLMRYLCNSHRAQFINDPHHAAQSWQLIMLQAREIFHLQDWQKAAIVYGNAFEISELLLVSHPTAFSVDRYLRTALEFAYALRKNQTDTNLNALIPHITENIQNIKHSMAMSFLIQPVEEVINLPIHLSDHWMQSLLSLDSLDHRVLH